MICALMSALEDNMWRKVLLICGVALLTLAGADMAEAAKKKVKSPPPAPQAIWDAPMRVVVVRSNDTRCMPLCPEWIAAEGEITAATPAIFRKVLKQVGNRKLPVIIRSPGGSIQAALEVGRMIRKRGLDVSVGWTAFSGCAPDARKCLLPKDQKGVYRGTVLAARAFCNSACHLVLASGVQRLASVETFVGVHQPKTIWTREIVTYREHYKIVKGKKKVIDRKIVSRKPGKAKVTYGNDKRLRKLLLAYYKEMGVSPKLLEESEKAQFRDINQLNGAELNEFKLRTGSFGPDYLAAPQVCKKSPEPSNCVLREDKTT
jgi:hypothetical protein